MDLYLQAIQGSKFKTLDNCGYWAQFEQPQALAQVATSFLA
jgi:pimeloyl-ACP methyl ester carboxylesterase